jgi:hypothetical protein
MAAKIFINYRRGDDPGYTGRLFDWLQDVFDRQQLFIDVDNIAPGLDFVHELDERVGECDVMLAVIGKGWIDARDATGIRRLDDPSDFVRIEIESALSQGKRVIPVLVGDAQMPRADELPEALRPLVRRNAVRLTHERFSADIQGLVKALQQTLYDTGESRPASAIRLPREGREQPQAFATSQARTGMTPVKIAIASGSGLVLVALVAGAVAYVVAGKPPIAFPEPTHAPSQPSPQAAAPSAMPTQPSSQSTQTPQLPAEPSQPAQQSVRPSGPQIQTVEPQSGAQASAATEGALIDLATVRKMLPQDIPINPDMLRLVQTDPFFANAPAVRVASYSAFTKGIKNDFTKTTDFKLRPIGRGLAEYEQSEKYGHSESQETGIMAANGLISLSVRFINKSQGKVQSTFTGQLTQLDKLTGSSLLAAVGNQFSFRNVHTFSSSTGDLTYEETCRVSERRTASEFWHALTGGAFVITCQGQSNRQNETPKLIHWIFLVELGFMMPGYKLGLDEKDYHTVLTDVTLAP